MRGSAKFFPWIFDGADPVERSAVLTMPPPPVRVLCQYVMGAALPAEGCDDVGASS